MRNGTAISGLEARIVVDVKFLEMCLVITASVGGGAIAWLTKIGSLR